MVDSQAQVIGWVRGAYPTGVPESDAPALLSLLRQRLGSGRTLSLALRLVADDVLAAEHAAAATSEGAAIAETDHRRVAAQLVMGGWPLGSIGEDDDEDDTEEGSYLGRIVSWLREGYPSGVPEHDYVPLLALLNRRLTRGEVKKVAKALRRASIAPASPEDIAAAITDVTHTDATEADLQRVRDRLAAKGWPVDFPDPDPH